MKKCYLTLLQESQLQFATDSGAVPAKVWGTRYMFIEEQKKV